MNRSLNRPVVHRPVVHRPVIHRPVNHAIPVQKTLTLILALRQQQFQIFHRQILQHAARIVAGKN